MGTINQVKQQAETDTPILFFHCVLPSGDIERWSTHALSFNGDHYIARVVKHNLFELQLSADDAMDGISKVSLTLANADSRLSELNTVIGLKGSQLTVYFAFVNLITGVITTESTILFKGLAGDPDEITEDALRLTFINKLSLQRLALPDVRVQRLCPWNFPANAEQRTEALNGGTVGRYSRFYRCGYSADITGGRGNLTSGQAYSSCDHSRVQCEARGMFKTDSAGRTTSRYGGFEFVPSSMLVRTNGAKNYHTSPVVDTTAKYNDAVPMVYGTGWLDAPVVFSRNDGNLTHCEALLGLGTVQSILKVVVNGIEIPLGVPSQDMTATGWYSLVANGSAQGAFNLDFADGAGHALGDPNGSIAVLGIVVPNRTASGRTAPHVEVLMQGMQLDCFNADGSFQATTFTNNPAWVILDIVRRSGWSTADLNLATFASSATYCQTLIATTDLNGNSLQIPRFQCNVILTKRKSAAEIVRGIRVAASLMLRYGVNGLLELLPETTIANQQPSLPDGSNSTQALDGGWPTYEFSDASGPFSGIVRNGNGSSTIRISSRSIAETSNRLSVEFQDESNEYQQDSLSVVDSDDSALIGYEIASQSTALGIANFSQATRVLLRQLDKLTKGNEFIEFQTSFRALKVRPGDIISVTYLKEGLTRVAFRVVKLAPSTNYEVVTILAQIHDDNWYSDDPAVLGGAGRQPGSHLQTPRPLLGPVFNSNKNTEFGVQESIQGQSDGSATDILTVSFVKPTKPSAQSPNLPLLSLAPLISSTGGTLAGGTNSYYAVSALDSAGREGALSFTVFAKIPPGPATNSIQLTGLSFPTMAVAFNVYRGTTPQLLYRIASGTALASTYTDVGAPDQAIGPPDSNFDHANFYYRLEYAGPFLATSYGATEIGNSDMGAVPLAYAGLIARIVSGTGIGQERQITTNDQATLTITPAWTMLPDASSNFVITEGAWRFGAISTTSPVQFEVPYRTGTVVEISGRGANSSDQEGEAALCPVTRWALGGVQADADVALAPSFTLNAPGQGNVVISQVGFQNLTNTTSVTAGTLQAIYWNELQTPSSYKLASNLDASSTTVYLSAIATPTPNLGDVILVNSELMSILAVDAMHKLYTVQRQVLGSTAISHGVGATVMHLQSSTFVMPFALDFFENRASQNYSHSVVLPEVRICAAQYYVTNACGNSQTSTQCYTSGTEGGLRTLSGGQYSMQVNGYLAVEDNAAPPLVVEASHAVRDIRATVSEAPGSTAINLSLFQTPQGGSTGFHYCDLVIAPGNLISNVFDGVTLPPLLSGSTLALNITQVGQAWSTSPGRDLTVTIRL